MSKFQITGGVCPSALKFVIYGPEGIGKTTFARGFPKPVFIDTEGSTKFYDVARFPTPSSWEMLLEEVDDIFANPFTCDTLVIDTADWAEKLCITKVCAAAKKSGIEEFGYGRGYVYVYEEFAKLLHKLDDVVNRGVNVVLNAHAALRKFEQPDENGAYDRWELKLINAPKANICAMVKEWSDVIIFANYQTYVTASDDKGKNFKASGNKRVMYLNHHPCWDAKNRFGLPDGMDFLYGYIDPIVLRRNEIGTPAGEMYIYQLKAQMINNTYPTVSADDPDKLPASEKNAENSVSAPENASTGKLSANEKGAGNAVSCNIPNTASVPENAADGAKIDRYLDNSPVTFTREAPPGNIPQKLLDLMLADGITEAEIRKAVSIQGYYPESTPISTYADEFVNGAIIATWPNLVRYIKETVRDLPF